jgi:hypothetical protein
MQHRLVAKRKELKTRIVTEAGSAAGRLLANRAKAVTRRFAVGILDNGNYSGLMVHRADAAEHSKQVLQSIGELETGDR